jgi:hypothetical protein
MKQRVPETLLEIVKIDLRVFLALKLYYLSVILSDIRFEQAMEDASDDKVYNSSGHFCIFFFRCSC